MSRVQFYNEKIWCELSILAMFSMSNCCHTNEGEFEKICGKEGEKMKSKPEFREIPITTYRNVKVRKYPEDIRSLNKRIQKVIVKYFEKGIKTSSITGFNFQYKGDEIWIYQWADVPGEGSISIIKKENAQHKIIPA